MSSLAANALNIVAYIVVPFALSAKSVLACNSNCLSVVLILKRTYSSYPLNVY